MIEDTQERPTRIKGTLKLPYAARKGVRNKLRTYRGVERVIERRNRLIRKGKDVSPQVWSYKGLNSGDTLLYKRELYTVDHFLPDTDGRTRLVNLNSYSRDGQVEQVTILTDLIDFKKRTIRNRIPAGHVFAADSLPAHAASATLSAPIFALALLASPISSPKPYQHTHVSPEAPSYELSVHDARNYSYPEGFANASLRITEFSSDISRGTTQTVDEVIAAYNNQVDFISDVPTDAVGGPIREESEPFDN